MSQLDKDLELTKKYDKDYCMQVFAPMNVAFNKGKGVYFYDTDGRKYMDMKQKQDESILRNYPEDRRRKATPNDAKKEGEDTP